MLSFSTSSTVVYSSCRYPTETRILVRMIIIRFRKTLIKFVVERKNEVSSVFFTTCPFKPLPLHVYAHYRFLFTTKLQGSKETRISFPQNNCWADDVHICLITTELVTKLYLITPLDLGHWRHFSSWLLFEVDYIQRISSGVLKKIILDFACRNFNAHC